MHHTFPQHSSRGSNRPQPPQRRRPAVAAPRRSQDNNIVDSSGGGAAPRGSGATSYAPLQLVPRSDPLVDVQIGPLVGKGAYGRVYRGHWNGSMVRAPRPRLPLWLPACLPAFCCAARR
jgi:hypothetical protein